MGSEASRKAKRRPTGSGSSPVGPMAWQYPPVDCQRRVRDSRFRRDRINKNKNI